MNNKNFLLGVVMLGMGINHLGCKDNSSCANIIRQPDLPAESTHMDNNFNFTESAVTGTTDAVTFYKI